MFYFKIISNALRHNRSKTVNFFNSDMEYSFHDIRKKQPDLPLMVGEFWGGWYDHWGEPHNGRSPEEFREFIGENIRLDTVSLSDEESIADLLEFYMGDNTIDRQNFIRQNLKSEEELDDINI